MICGNDRWPQTDGRLVYAIGDIHGRDDLLALMIDAIEADAQARQPAVPMLILLGDYIDRGRHVVQVMERLTALRCHPRFEVRLLLGNHEEAMIDVIDGRASGRIWARFGGDATMEAYGVRVPARDDGDEAWQAARKQFAAAVPAHHLALLRGLELTVTVGDIVFVHAGLRPGIPLAQQTRDDLLGIRNDFLTAEPFDAPFVVHGHTPVDACVVWPHRLNLDSGAYMTGRLSAGRFDGGPPAILTATAGGTRVEPASLAIPR